MGVNSLIVKRKNYGLISVAFGTAIVRLVEPVKGCFTTITDMWYTSAGTAHTLTVLRPLGKTYVSSAAAAAQKVINIAANPGTYSSYGTIDVANNNIAANDYCVYQTADGTYTVDTVASVSSLAITMTSDVPTSGVAKYAPFWFFGITTDTNPADGLAHPAFSTTASATTKLGSDPADVLGGIVGSIAPPPQMRAMTGWPLNGREEPLIVYSNNATATGTLEKVSVVYSTIGS